MRRWLRANAEGVRQYRHMVIGPKLAGGKGGWMTALLLKATVPSLNTYNIILCLRLSIYRRRGEFELMPGRTPAVGAGGWLKRLECNDKISIQVC